MDNDTVKGTRNRKREKKSVHTVGFEPMTLKWNESQQKCRLRRVPKPLDHAASYYGRVQIFL